MSNFSRIVLRAASITLACIVVGLVSNLIPARHIPWFYFPDSETTVSGQKIPFITVQDAEKLLGDPFVVFIDTREEKDYALGHVSRALFMNPENQESLFPGLEPLISPDSKVVLYCYGPECDMAGRVSAFLINFGYTNLMIMKDGFLAWEKKGLPTEGLNRSKR